MQLTKQWAAVLDDYVIDLAWSPDGARLAAASGAGPLTLLEADTGSKQQVFAGQAEGTNCLAWSLPGIVAASSGFPAVVQLASGGQDGAVKFWDVAAGQHTATVK